MAIAQIDHAAEVLLVMRLLKIKLAKFVTQLVWKYMGERRETRNAIPVLCYHRVLPELVEGEDPVYSVTPQQFESQMAFLAKQGFQSLSLSEFYEMAQGRRMIPRRAVLITFDDGFADVYSCAWPIARRYGFKLNLFLCTGLICGLRPTIYSALSPEASRHQHLWPDLWRSLTWEEIREMAASNLEIGFHSHSHTQLSALSQDELKHDLAIGLSLCEHAIGHRPRYFALPEGTYESYNNKVLEVIQRYGAELIFTTRLGRTRLGGACNFISRIVIHQEDDLSTFERKLFGAYDWLGNLRHVAQIARVFLRTNRASRRNATLLSPIVAEQAHTQD
jgi:peptidoglycan/xylan/chitin deacetylase (PgdA/CDA1 family)